MPRADLPAEEPAPGLSHGRSVGGEARGGPVGADSVADGGTTEDEGEASGPISGVGDWLDKLEVIEGPPLHPASKTIRHNEGGQ